MMRNFIANTVGGLSGLMTIYESFTTAKFIRHLAPQGPDDLFFCMDRNQSIRREAFSWKDVGISVTGRSQPLKINYRTTEEIYQFSEAILGTTKLQNSENNSVESIIKGPEPEVISCSTEEDEISVIAEKLVSLVQDGLHVSEIALVARTSDLLRRRAETALRISGFRGSKVKNSSRPQGRYIALTTMDNAIGLEFRAVVAIGCEESNFLSAEFGMTPEQAQNIETQERRRLYVACTRARERLVLTSAGPMTHFISSCEAVKTKVQAKA